METFKVSVIIPVYNTEQSLLIRCVNSVLSQNYSNYECIIVDDGSSDENAKMIDTIKKLDNRIRIYHKKNGGQGNTRNFGVSKSDGDYVFFLDSDDYISPSAFEIGMKIAKDSNSDMIVGGLIHVEENEDPGFQQSEKTSVLIEEESDKESLIMHMAGVKQERYFLSKGQTGTSACARFVKRKIAYETPFENDKFWDEDNLWNIFLVKKCNRITVSDICWYAYVINSDSNVRKYSGARTVEFQTRAKQEYKIISELWPRCIKGAYNQIWEGFINYCRTDTFHKFNPKKNADRYKDFCNAINFDEFKIAIRKIDFDYEKRAKYRFAKITLKYLLLFFNKRLAFLFLSQCVRRIKF